MVRVAWEDQSLGGPFFLERGTCFAVGILDCVTQHEDDLAVGGPQILLGQLSQFRPHTVRQPKDNFFCNLAGVGHVNSYMAQCQYVSVFLSAQAKYGTVPTFFLYGTAPIISSMKDKQPAKDQDKIITRLPRGMRERLAEAAEMNNRSVNAEVVARLEASLSKEAVGFAMTSEDARAYIAGARIAFEEAFKEFLAVATKNMRDRAAAEPEYAEGIASAISQDKISTGKRSK